jgi:D-threonate/D-erythronate kinase
MIDANLHADYSSCVQPALKNLDAARRDNNACRWLVLADDLSGAAECAAAFATPRRPVLLRLDPQLAGDEGQNDAPATVWDLGSRNAGFLVAPALTGLLPESARVYIKVDSLLRGRWAELLAQLHRMAGRPILLCPALPRLGRGVRDGLLQLSPFEEERIGAAHQGLPIASALETAGLSVGCLGISRNSAPSAIDAGIEASIAQHAVAIVNAETDSELDMLAASVRSARLRPFICGSAGLLNAIARLFASSTALGSPAASSPDGDDAIDALASPLGVLVGSLTPPARIQLDRLSAASGVGIEYWSKEQGWTGSADADGSQALRLLATSAVTASTDANLLIAKPFALAASRRLGGVRTIVATGGETARALCDVMGVKALAVVGEIEAGVCLARIPGEPERLLVLKSGSFGDEDTLLRLACRGPLASTREKS